MRDIDQYFHYKEEPVKSCLLAMRNYLLQYDPNITEAWKYRMPMYCYNGKMCCYLWIHKKWGQPYLGVVEGKLIEHPGLLEEKRARMKIFLLDPSKDLPIKELNKILKQMVKIYQ